jgi:thiamine biosynthesis lipoprotein
VIRAGYDRSFDDLPATRSRRPASHLTVGCADIEVTDHHVTLPEGTGFDPGGIGKGLAADLIGREIRAAGADGVCVNLGGDLRVSGSAPGGGTWTVGVEHAWSAAPLALIGLAGGAVATSTTLRRRWELDGVEHHHLIDPGTGEPSDTDLTSATVVTGQAWMAEVLAKAVLLRGSAHPFDLIGGTSAEAIVVDEAGRVTASPGFGAYLGSARPPDGIKVAPHDRRCPA